MIGKAEAGRQTARLSVRGPATSCVLSPNALPIPLLVASSVSATFAWYGHQVCSAAEPKTMQEAIALGALVFLVLFLKEGVTWDHPAGLALIAGAATLIFGA